MSAPDAHDETGVIDAIDEIGPSSTPRPRPDVRTVEVGTEVLLYDPVVDRGLPLNPAAAIVWQCLDGRSSLAEIAADVADHFGAPIETVLRDAVAVARDLATRGLLGDRPTTTHTGESRAAFPRPPEGVPVFTVDAGGRAVAVGCDDPELLVLLRAALSPCETASATADAVLHLEVATPPGRLEGVHLLWLDGRIVLRTPDRGRLLRAALAHLGGLVPVPENVTRLDAHVLLGADTVVLVGGAFRDVLELFHARLYRCGWRMVDGNGPLVDRTTFDVLLGPPPLALAPGGVAAIDAALPRGREEPPWTARRLPIRCVVTAGSEPDQGKLMTPAQRLAGLVPLARDPADLAWLARLAERTETRWVLGLDEQELLRLFEKLPRRAPRR